MEKQTDWIQTYTGRKMYPLEPDAVDVHIHDIAHSLSLKCRFNGHVNDFYSVAQHSVLMAHHISTSPYLQMWALMHDAGEAYLADIPRPVKPYTGIHIPPDTFHWFDQVEDNLRNTIFEAIVPRLHNTSEPPEVKELDLRILINEAFSFMNLNAVNRSTWGALEGVHPIHSLGTIKSWPWKVAREEFIRTYTYLQDELKRGDEG